jgi:DNA-binding NtrC family response regulator
LGKPAPEFAAEVLAAFKSYYWPGNVRQLENTVQRLVVMADADIVDPGDLPGGTGFLVSNGEEGGRTLAEVAAGYIAKVLASVGGNKTRAAAILGIDRRTLRKKLAISQALNPS